MDPKIWRDVTELEQVLGRRASVVVCVLCVEATTILRDRRKPSVIKA